MSVATRALKIAVIAVLGTAMLMTAISLNYIHSTVTHQTETALQSTRLAVKQTVGHNPNWSEMIPQYPLLRFTAVDTETNATLIDENFNNASSGLTLWVEDHLLPDAQRISVHGYEISIRLNNQQLVENTLNLLFPILLTVLIAGSIGAFGIFTLISRNIKRNVSLTCNAIDDLSALNKSAQLPSLASPEFTPINTPLSAAIERLIEPLMDAQAHVETLKRHAYSDGLTGLGNKAKFKEDMLEKLQSSSTTNYGLLVIIRATSLKVINDQSGYGAGDDYVKQIANLVNNAAAHFQRQTQYRLNSSDIAVVLDFIAKKEHEKFASTLESQLNDLNRKLDVEEVANVGITDFQSGDGIGDLLSRCDNALSISSSRRGNNWHFSDSPIDSQQHGKQQWRALIADIIENARVTLYGQPQLSLNESATVYTELQARFFDANNEQVSTASLIAQAQSSDLIIQLDKVIVENALALARDTAPYVDRYAINLSNSSVLDAHFCIWLERQLLRDAAVTRRLVFEVSEHGITTDITAGRRIIDLIHRVGARFTIEHFGTSIMSLKYFRELNPDYVKLDASHTFEIEADKKLQYFIRTLVDITHQMGVRVIAEAVETVEQKQLYERLNVDVVQGYFVGKPEPIVSPQHNEQTSYE
ncbi:EAL domain-containing protein [Echinimonas agarilytica]|uniref:GGDEF domain-containing protein n=1 Tax=Echinimonas agarilytica TaxID=1215918 RepID=A0AA42B8F7_9GAMM|nr:GGDEF domain-containing protein [Echinimonas agarilytica]MCM2680812.1 GGDEF domain-containing protein [Echinimonas agarilytica]